MSFLSKIGFDLEVAIANLVNFLVLFILFKLFFFKPIQQAIDARKQKIERGLQDAEAATAARSDAEAAAAKVLTEAKEEAREILADAKQHADALKEQATVAAQQERTVLIQRAEQDIASEKQKMQSEVESEMTRLVASLTKKAIQEK